MSHGPRPQDSIDVFVLVVNYRGEPEVRLRRSLAYFCQMLNEGRNVFW